MRLGQLGLLTALIWRRNNSVSLGQEVVLQTGARQPPKLSSYSPTGRQESHLPAYLHFKEMAPGP